MRVNAVNWTRYSRLIIYCAFQRGRSFRWNQDGTFKQCLVLGAGGLPPQSASVTAATTSGLYVPPGLALHDMLYA